MARFYHDSDTGEQGYHGEPAPQEKAAESGTEELTPEEIEEL